MSRQASLRTPVRRCLAVWAGATVVAGTLLGCLLPHLAGSRHPAPARFDLVLVTGCELVAAAGTAWLWLLVTLVVRDAVRGRAPTSRDGVPATVRRLVLAGCGLSLAGGLLTPAGALPSDPDRAAAAEVLVGLSVPDRMPTTQWLGRVRQQVRRQHPVAAPAHRPRGRGPEVVVGRGDTLWGLATRTLPPDADAADIDRRWREIYRANRGVIGADPHLILPGQRLRLPPRHDRGEE